MTIPPHYHREEGGHYNLTGLGKEPEKLCSYYEGKILSDSG